MSETRTPGGRYHCRDCNANLKTKALRCWTCHRARLDDLALAKGVNLEQRNRQREYMANYMRNLRHLDPRQFAQRLLKRQLDALRRRPIVAVPCREEFCLYFGYDHHHCACGLVLGPSEVVCPWCVMEQPRLEHTLWTTEEITAVA